MLSKVPEDSSQLANPSGKPKLKTLSSREVLLWTILDKETINEIRAVNDFLNVYELP